jgi:hypothetical protein
MNSNVSNTSSFGISPDYVTVGIRMVQKNQYQKLLSEFAQKGFVRVNTDTHNPQKGISTNYRSARYPNMNLNILIESPDWDNQNYTAYNFLLCLSPL